LICGAEGGRKIRRSASAAGGRSTKIHVIVDGKGRPGRISRRTEVEYLVGQKWTSTPDDVLWRRSKLGLHPPGDSRKRPADWIADASANPAQGVMPSSGRARQHWGQTSKPALIASPQCGHRLCAWYDRPRFLVACFFDAINKA